jgi:molecular chaperone DnaK (HSP70)
MLRPRYIIGIDLGTTNCAVAYVDTKGRERPTADIHVYDVPQLVGPGEVTARSMLPSFLYLPAGPELPEGATKLPWNPTPDRFAGVYAQAQGARVPGRLVSSAKSWLCHAGVDREAAILPWGAPSGVPKLSPVEASAEYLRHIRDAWNHTHRAAEHPELKLEAQEIVLTVPASFDEAARELTVQAARNAGFEKLTLIEEPQAAFYCWIVTHQEGWQSQVKAGEKILVCDIGGGTSDFSLITVVETPAGPAFKRVAVGDHLMLGGDNLDLALAHVVEKKLGNTRLDTEQWSILRHACRLAKEKLLGDAPPEQFPVTIPGRGSRVIGGSLASSLSRQDVLDSILDGFFPRVTLAETLAPQPRAGLQEFGLPFVSDPAITRHLAGFLTRHAAEVASAEGQPVRPDAILFNGGALTPTIVRDRIVDVVASWFPAPEGVPPFRPRVLSNASLDLAVAIGAAYYGVVRRGGGIRIGGGTARSFYVGFESAGDPTASSPWLCVVPRDAQEGDVLTIEGRDFELRMGQPVAFPLASSSVRPQDRAGDLVPLDPASILDLPPLVGTMRVGRKARADLVPVRLSARVTEIGTIEIHCESRTDDRQWRLQIQLRGPATTRTASGDTTTLLADVSSGEVIEQSELDAGAEAIRAAFSNPVAQADEGVSRLIKSLESALDAPRDRWPVSALRALWEPLHDAIPDRTRSPQHEARWLNLAGYCLRPGTGFPLDDTRIKALWPVFHQNLTHQKDTQCWTEWWVLWRRVAAGLNRSHHDEIYRRLTPFLLGTGKKPSRPRPSAHEHAEMFRCAAALERLPADAKLALGNALWASANRPDSPPTPTLDWCIGRLGARVPLYGPANTVIPPSQVQPWLDRLLAKDRKPAPDRETTERIFALTQIARVSGDRVRDLDDPTRARVLDALADLGASDESLRPVREHTELQSAQQSAALGDSLPAGLRLVASE